MLRIKFKGHKSLLTASENCRYDSEFILFRKDLFTEMCARKEGEELNNCSEADVNAVLI